MSTKNKKSDVGAKNVFKKELEANGFVAEIRQEPSDIVAQKDGQTWYYEIKMTRRDDVYFGAATSTEWAKAFADPEHYRFVVAICLDEEETDFDFIEYTPAEFMEFSTIPPFKVYFNIDFSGKRRKNSAKRTAIQLTKDRFEKLNDCYQSLKEFR